ncbi:MAG: DUF5615 family PIN-like protein [Bacteroidia bacterium]
MADELIFLIDESVDYRLVKIIRDLEFRIIEIDQVKRGQSDEQVVHDANASNAIIVTEDKDFGELTYRQKIKNNGIILLRISGLDFLKKILIIREAFSNHSPDFKNSFTVITKSGIRIRKLKI